MPEDLVSTAKHTAPAQVEPNAAGAEGVEDITSERIASVAVHVREPTKTAAATSASGASVVESATAVQAEASCEAEQDLSRRQRATSGGEQVEDIDAVAGIVQRGEEKKDYASGNAGAARPPPIIWSGELSAGRATASMLGTDCGLSGTLVPHSDC